MNTTNLETTLTRALFRHNCPPSQTLGDHHLGLLAGDGRQAIIAHLTDCPHCRREVAQLADFLGAVATDITPSLRARVRVLIARLLGDPPAQSRSGPLPAAPALAGIRGDDDGPSIFAADGYQIIVEFQPDADAPQQRTLQGLIIGADDPTVFQAALWHDGRHVAVVPVDELGNFTLSHLPSVAYELVLSSPTTEIHIQTL